MEQPPGNHNNAEHIIDIERDANPATQTSSSSNIVTDLAARRGHDGAGHSSSRILSIIDSRFLLTLISILSQITASIVILVLSWHKKPPVLLVYWIMGYTTGCAAWLPLIFSSSYAAIERLWFEKLPFSFFRIMTSLCEEDRNRQELSINRSVVFYKISLDMLFIFLCVSSIPVGSHSDSPSSDLRDLYRLFIAFSIFSYTYSSWIFMELFLACCFITWIIFSSYLGCATLVLGSIRNLNQNRDASANLNLNQTTESSAQYTNSLPTYKYVEQKDKRIDNGEASSGVVVVGTERERPISGDDAVCCICLATYVNNDELKELPCSHLFHSYCVDKWLKINALCPLCKTQAW